ncbi:MAG: hypothetical protein HN417_11665 [Desulfobacula sp.]|jgi:hypothetical protein|nr:hypothetical protein [Desulfobacula sp.]
MQCKKENLNGMSLPLLFEIREKQLVLNYKDSFDRYVEGCRFYGRFFVEVIRARSRIFLSEITIEVFPSLKQSIIKKRFNQNEFDFLNSFERGGSVEVVKTLKKLGVQIDIQFENDNVKDQFTNIKGNFILSNHQHELDTFMQALFPQNHHWGAKANLLQYPLFGKVLGKGEPIVFYRGDTKKGQIKKRASEIVTKLQKSENVAIFFEGTRTFTGEIGDNRDLASVYTSKLMSEVEEIAKEKNFKVKKLFVVLKTFDSFSNIGNLDKKSSGSAITKSNISKLKEILASTRFKNNRIVLHIYGDRNFTYHYSEDEDENNIFGFFRKKVKEIVIEDILSHQDKAVR